VLQWYSVGRPVLRCHRTLNSVRRSPRSPALDSALTEPNDELRRCHTTCSPGSPITPELISQAVPGPASHHIRPAPFGPPLPPLPILLPASLFASRPTPLRSSSTPLVFVVPDDAPRLRSTARLVCAQRRVSSASNGVPRPRPMTRLARAQRRALSRPTAPPVRVQ
jgi:hypothetical protein